VEELERRRKEKQETHPNARPMPLTHYTNKFAKDAIRISQ